MRTLGQAATLQAGPDPVLSAALEQVAVLTHENAVLGRHLASAQARATRQAIQHAQAIAAVKRQLERLRAAAGRRAAEAQALRDALRQLRAAIPPSVHSHGGHAEPARNPR